MSPEEDRRINATVTIGTLNAGSGAVTVAGVVIYEGDSEEERERKIAAARGMLAGEIFFNLRSLDTRLLVAREAGTPDQFAARLREGMRTVAPAVAEINANGYAQLLSKATLASLRQAFAHAPLRTDLTDAIRQVVATAQVPPEQVSDLYAELTEAASRSDGLLEAVDAGARQADAHAARRLSLAARGLDLQSRRTFLFALRLLDAIPGQALDLDALQILKRPPSLDAALVDVSRGLIALHGEKVAFLAEYAAVPADELTRGLAEIEARLTINPTDRYNEVVGKAISLRQFGRVEDAERAFAKYGEMFGSSDPTARRYSSIAQAFTRQAAELDLSGGVYLFQVDDGAAAAAGLQTGDIITRYGLHPVANPNELTAAMAKHARDPAVPLHVLRFQEDGGTFDRLLVHVPTGRLAAGFMPI